MERRKMYKRTTTPTENQHPLLSLTTMTTPITTPVITEAELTAVEIIETAIANHLNLTTPPPSPQPTLPLPTFPLTIALDSPATSPVHIDSQDPSPFALRQPLPDDTLDSPIDYERMDEEKENEDPNDPGLPFFPNNPTSLRYYPLYIQLNDPSPDGPARVLAKYIFYHKKGQEVVGCMGKGEPWYGDSVYLVAHPPTRMAVPMTTTQLDMFHPDDSRAYVINKALIRLDQPRLTAEVSRLRDGLVRVGQVKKQLSDLRRQEQLLSRALFAVDMEMNRVQRRMEQVQALEQITNAHVAYTPVRTATEDRMPLTPRRGGPVERPLLRGRGRNHLCYNCHEQGHIAKKCPLKKPTKKYCRHCNSHLHFPNECIFKRFDALSEATVAENVACINQANHTPNWRGKCLCNMPGHKEIDCPSYESCGKCWVRGPYGFLKRHKCIEEADGEDEVNDPGADIYDYVGSD